mgnify:CR=1 FL=1
MPLLTTRYNHMILFDNVPFCIIFKEHYGTLGGKKGTLPYL